MPPMTPSPSQITQSWWINMPTPEMMNPPPQHSAATTPALRGPARSSQPPNTAADRPRKTMPIVKMIRRLVTGQSHDVVNSDCTMVMSGQATGLVMPIACAMGSQNTLRP